MTKQININQIQENVTKYVLKKVKHAKSILQSWAKMLRKMDVTMSSFKIKFFKELLITNTSFFPPPPKNNVEVQLDYFCP